MGCEWSNGSFRELPRDPSPPPKESQLVLKKSKGFDRRDGIGITVSVPCEGLGTVFAWIRHSQVVAKP